MSAPERELADLCFNSCASNLQDIRNAVRVAMQQAGCGEKMVNHLVLVIDEAIANIIRHGYHGSECGDIRLRISLARDQLKFELFDWAQPVDPAGIRPRDLNECRPGGLGINFIDTVMDSWEFQRPPEGVGNVLVMNKRLEQGIP